MIKQAVLAKLPKEYQTEYQAAKLGLIEAKTRMLRIENDITEKFQALVWGFNPIPAVPAESKELTFLKSVILPALEAPSRQ
jgi:hypothetical protein